MAEGDGAGFPAVLAADAELEVRLDGSAFLNGDLHQEADAGLVDAFERVDREDLLRHVRLEELVAVVAGEVEGHWCRMRRLQISSRRFQGVVDDRDRGTSQGRKVFVMREERRIKKSRRGCNPAVRGFQSLARTLRVLH